MVLETESAPAAKDLWKSPQGFWKSPQGFWNHSFKRLGESSRMLSRTTWGESRTATSLYKLLRLAESWRNLKDSLFQGQVVDGDFASGIGNRSNLTCDLDVYTIAIKLAVYPIYSCCWNGNALVITANVKSIPTQTRQHQQGSTNKAAPTFKCVSRLV